LLFGSVDVVVFVVVQPEMANTTPATNKEDLEIMLGM